MNLVCARYREKHNYTLNTEIVFEKEGKYYWFFFGGSSHHWMEFHVSHRPPDGTKKVCYRQKLGWDIRENRRFRHYSTNLTKEETSQIQGMLFSVEPKPESVIAMFSL